MLSILFRKFACLALAVALVAPPLMGALDKAFGGDGSHVHFDHIWHDVDLADGHDHGLSDHDSSDHDSFGHDSSDHDSSGHDSSGHAAAQDHNDTGSDGQTHTDHVHLITFVMADQISLTAPALLSAYETEDPPFHFGRHPPPLARPPLNLS